ncbi:GAF domain-containing protein [Salinicoccus kekensis]|uniref:GAF domain-containing protein n=1 Tax=Salinicoccus kekensis TaxID=714307 RepID=A0A285UFJ1_9STAP|nr:GAF domain-containing protein [Salinicoccus kekensis]SOC40640.1 GAF domain-containing protein [Salinicoccus kekensis]
MSAKHFFSYVISLIFVVTALILFSAGTARLLEQTGIGISYITIITAVCAVTGFYTLVVASARGFRSSAEKISLFGLRFNNPVYDPEFEDVPQEEIKNIRSDNKALQNELAQLKEFTETLLHELELKDEELEDIQYVSETYIRHHKNSSRLIRTLMGLMADGGPGWVTEFYDNVLDESITVLHRDRADKSSTLFMADDGKLKMAAYHRVNLISVDTREFSPGEGFAGRIWETGEVELVNNINESSYFEGDFSPIHNYGSVIGLPVKINQATVGVLCIQSEGIDGFIEEDVDTLKFYADICGLAYYYDNMNVKIDAG